MAEKNAAVPELQTRDLSDLAALARGGDEESFSLLVKAFQPVIFAIVASIDVPPAEKDDLSQEGLIGLYKAVLLFDSDRAAFGTFARICIRSALLDGLRKCLSQKEVQSFPLGEELLSAEAEAPEQVLLGKEGFAECMRKIDSVLSPLERRILGLHLQGTDAVGIAALLGRNKKSVENSLYRVRRKLSSLFSNR